jgi:hypothetical protein
MLWHFKSFNYAKFSFLDEATVRSALLWDEGAFYDTKAVERLAAHIAAHGITYDSLSESDSELLDQLILSIFSPEGIQSVLEVEPESPDGVHPTVIREMLKHGVDAKVLPWLLNGRTHNSQSRSAVCNYIILTPEEVAQLFAECRSLLNREVKWSQPYIPETVRECLVEPLESIHSKGKHAVGILG